MLKMLPSYANLWMYHLSSCSIIKKLHSTNVCSDSNILPQEFLVNGNELDGKNWKL